MERSEPSLVPEWYKGASSNNFNPLSGSSNSGVDELNSGFSSRNRLSISFCEHDASPRSLSFTERTPSSFYRSASNNGSMGREGLPLRPYSSFGRSHYDRNKDREKDLELCRNQPLLEDHVFFNNAESLATIKSEKESLWHSHSMVSGSGDSWLKRPAQDSSKNVPSGGNIIAGISQSSFERDFPSLGAEEKNVGSDVARVTSTGSSTAIHNLQVAASTTIGGDGWTSALAQVPPLIVGENSPVVSSTLPTSPVLTIVSSPSSGLNMAETVAQAPPRVHTSSQLPSDSQKIEELHRLQTLKLRPVMPSIPKNLCLSSAEKSKTKTARTAEISASKAGQQLSSQLIIHDVRPAARSDVYKIFQPGNFRVLNREKNSPTSPAAIPPPTIHPPKGSLNLKLKADGKGDPSSPKKLPSQVQNRNDFFNSLRKKTSSGQQSNANNVSNNEASSFVLEKVGAQFAIDSPAKTKVVFHCSVENEDCSAGECDAFEEPEKLAPDEEEAAFLRSLGWEENAGVEALTHEEIESFLSLHKMRRPASKLNI